MIMTASAARSAGILAAIVAGRAGAGSMARGAASAWSAACARGDGTTPAAIEATTMMRYAAAGRFHMFHLRGLTVLVWWTPHLPGLVRNSDRLGERALMLSSPARSGQ